MKSMPSGSTSTDVIAKLSGLWAQLTVKKRYTFVTMYARQLKVKPPTLGAISESTKGEQQNDLHEFTHEEDMTGLVSLTTFCGSLLILCGERFGLWLGEPNAHYAMVNHAMQNSTQQVEKR